MDEVENHSPRSAPVWTISLDDRSFVQRFESRELSPESFDHRAHLRLAYVYLAENDADTAQRMMREALLGFLQHNGINPAKYHETMTRAWIMAVRHFMALTPRADSADSFIEQNPALLDSSIMLTHYSRAKIFSDEARAQFVEPDLDPIPRYRP